MSTRVRTVNCFGDSFVYGYGDREKQLGWAGRLRQEFHAINEVEGDVEMLGLAAFYNLAILGNTALQVLERAERERVIRRGKAVLNILSVGLNDSATHSDGRPFVKEKEFEAALRDIADNFTVDDNASMMYVGFPSFDDQYTKNFRDRGITYTTKRAERYEDIALNVYADLDIQAVPLFEVTNTGGYLTEKLDKDHFHPNGDGYQVIYERVRPKAIELLGTIED